MRNQITCYGIGTKTPRVYWRFSEITETGIGTDGVWYTTPIDASAASNIPPDSAMTCFGLFGTKSRVYAINAMGGVVEIGWSGNNQWYSVDVGALARAPRAAHGSAITCFGVDGKATRVYYFDEQGRVIELGWGADNSWYADPISETAGAPPAAPGSGITCFGAVGRATRLYYFDTSGQVVQIRWQDDLWQSAPIGALTASRPSGGGMAITCFGVAGTVPRVYYFDADGNPIELGFGADGKWYSRVIPTYELLAAGDSGIACLGVNGQATRLYYFAVDGSLVEVGWGSDNRWYAANLSASAGAPQSAGSVACFAEGGTATRLYYLTSGPSLWEVRWVAGGWSVGLVYQCVQ